MKHYDVILIGAGAAGLFCAALASQRGLRVLLIDHSAKTAEKIRISGGGRCNFTNQDLDLHEPERHFLSQNPRFCRSAIKRFSPQDFIDLVAAEGIAYHEKHRGQLFCDGSSQEIIRMLERLGETVERWQACSVEQVLHQDGRYALQTTRGQVSSPQLVVATGGLSIPQIGASDWGYRIAKQFGIALVATQPGLVPLTFVASAWQSFTSLSGVSLPVTISTVAKGKGTNPAGKMLAQSPATTPAQSPAQTSAQASAQSPAKSAKQTIRFHEDLLFSHRGLTGPAALQISSYLHAGDEILINLLPDFDAQFNPESRKSVANELAQFLPSRLAELWVAQQAAWQAPVHSLSASALFELKNTLQNWRLQPSGSEGYKKAEVTVGGVDTRALSSQSMECNAQKGLYFIGEVVDVTGWLGGYNFQWAWSSAHACAQSLQAYS